MRVRAATHNDLDFLADCFVKISRHMKAGEADTFISRLPSVVDNATQKFATRLNLFGDGYLKVIC